MVRTSTDGKKIMTNNQVRIERQALVDFCATTFGQLGLSAADARVAADVLVAADARGIPSHGVARLQRYVNGLETGQMLPDAQEKVLADGPTSLVVHAQGGMGAPVSARTMARIIDKAADTGAAFGCVHDSNHFGIAGYYAMMALEHDMLGIAMTNTAALGVPTFGRQVMFGTNPLAFAAPADKEGAFVLDMSTTVVTRGKIEVYERLERELPAGWAVDRTGRSAHNPSSLLDDMFHRTGGGILPLGGLGESFGGHKGYGLAVMVDILCGVLCGAPFGSDLADTATSSGRVSHFFGAIRIDSYHEPAAFRRDMDRMLLELRTSPVAADAERVYYAGLKEREMEEECRKSGVPLAAKTWRQLQEIAGTQGIVPPAVRD
jgi:L-2-hydroxycarboxylate dehydrogenase (NAD+)